MGGRSAPEADPRIGEAAVMSAELGQDALAWAKEQAAVTNKWAADDRARYNETFVPLQDEFIKEAQEWDSPERRLEARNKAAASVWQQTKLSNQANDREMAAMGVDPRSGRYGASRGAIRNASRLAAVGARNAADDKIEAQGAAKRASAINMGAGMAVNPGTSMGMSNSAMGGGFNAAMSGQGQMGSLLNTQHQQQMQAHQSNQSALGGLMGGLGSLAGVAMSNPGMFTMLSDEDAKTDKKPARGALKAVEKMRVDDWTYKPGQGDEGRHTGTYAQDFKAATGKGDGKSIPMIDAIGVTMGAVKELSAKVDKLAKPRGAIRGVAA